MGFYTNGQTSKETKKEMTMKIAIIGSRSYTNKRKIKEFIFQLKNKFKEDLVIVSGGEDGAINTLNDLHLILK